MPRAYHDWTEQDDILLTKLWEDRSTLTLDAMCAAIDCGLKSLHRRRAYLGLSPKIQRAADIWTPERVKILKDMWPNHSSREIGAVLGMTRNAILGKVHRLGLDTKGLKTPEYLDQLSNMRRQKARLIKASLREKHKVFRRSITATRKAKSLPVLPPDISISPEAPQGEPVRLLDLQPETCRYIVGRSEVDNLATFCPGHRVATNLPYCSYHHNISYNIQTRMRAG